MTEEYELSDMSSNKGFTGIWVNPEGVVDEGFSKQNNQNLKALGINQFIAFLLIGYTVFELSDRPGLRTLIKFDWRRDFLYIFYEQLNPDGEKYFETTQLKASHLTRLVKSRPTPVTLNRLVKRIRTFISPLQYQPTSPVRVSYEKDLEYNVRKASNRIHSIFEARNITEARKMISTDIES